MTTLLMILLPLLAAADEPSLHLPRNGEGCTFRETFEAGLHVTCGMSYYQLWSCEDSDYLIVGHFGKAGAAPCSPTFEVDSVVLQAKPMR